MVFKKSTDHVLAEILGFVMPNPDGYPFCIESEVDSLVLVHYDPDAIGTPGTPETLPQIRGLIIDRESGLVICSSFGYTPTVITDGSEVPVGDLLTLTDNDGIATVIDLKTARFQPQFEGTILRVWKWKGKVYYSTHRKIDAVSSKWGSSGKFVDLYSLYGGPDPDTLFDPSKEYSCDTHMFLVVDSNLSLASKMPLPLDEGGNGGFLVYLGTIQQFNDPSRPVVENLKNVPVDADLVQWNPKAGTWFEDSSNWARAEVELGKNPILDYTPEMVGTVQYPASFDWAMAGQLLTKGYYPDKSIEGVDPLLTPGEGVICLYDIGSSTGAKMLKLQSPSYNRRLEIIGNEPNVLLRAHYILEETKFPKSGSPDVYTSTFPPFALLTDTQFDKAAEYAMSECIELPFPDWKAPSESLLLTPPPISKEGRDARLRNALAWYAYSLPPAHQAYGFGLYKTIVQERNTVVEFILKNMDDIWSDRVTTSYPRDAKAWGRMKDIIKTARTQLVTQGKTGKKAALEYNVRYLVTNEAGNSLYQINRVIKNYYTSLTREEK